MFLFKLVFLIFLLPLLVFGQVPKCFKTINTEGGQIETMVYSKGKKYLLTGDSRGNLCLIDAKTFVIEKKIKAHTKRINSITFNNKGDLMLTATNTGEIKMWDFETLTLIKTYRDIDGGRITFCVFNPEESFIYFDLSDKIMKMSANFKQEPDLLFWHNSFSTCGQISPDKKYLVYGNGRQIYFVDINTDRKVRELGYCSGSVNEITFLNNNDFATWCQDGTISYWNKNKQGLIFVQAIKSFNSGDEGGYSKLEFSPTGKWLLAGGAGSSARVWDVKTDKKIFELRGHIDSVRTVQFGLSDSVAITAGYDHLVKVWRLIPEPEIAILKKDSVHNQEIIVQKMEIQKEIPKEVEKDKPAVPRIVFEPKVNGRNVDIRHEYLIKKAVNNKPFEIEIWDDESEDGDMVNVYLNGKKIAENFSAAKQKKAIPVELYEEQENYLVLEAVNMGKNPPNTVAVGFMNGNDYTRIKLETDLKNSVAIKFKVSE